MKTNITIGLSQDAINHAVEYFLKNVMLRDQSIKVDSVTKARKQSKHGIVFEVALTAGAPEAPEAPEVFVGGGK